MSKKNKQTRIKFSPYWFYGLLIFFIILSVLIDGNSKLNSIKQINISEFEKYLENGDINNIIIVKSERSSVAKVSINENALEKPEHQSLKGKNVFGKENIKGPHYQFEIGNTENFQNKIDTARTEGKNISYGYKTYKNRWSNFLISIIPIVIIIAIWLFIMRRMSSSGGWAEKFLKVLF